MAEIISGSDLPGSFIDDVDRVLRGSIPQEKIQCELRQAQIARSWQFSERIEGIGHRKSEIDPRLYFRMLQSFGHHEGWMDDVLRDNAMLRAPGVQVRKRKDDFRHGITFVGGTPVGVGPHSEKFA